jgi:hypothetical protein
MIDHNTAFRTVLINAATVTALVPATRIYKTWFPASATFPLITYQKTNDYNDDADYFDNEAKSDHVEIECHVFTLPNTSTFAIANAVDTAVKASGYNRNYSADLQDPGDYGHTVMRYSKRTILTV